MQHNQANKNIVVCITGLSPQVVTETIYVLANRSGDSPHEIHILTTLTGKDRAVEALLGDNGHMARMYREYGWDRHGVRFDADCIHVIHGADGKPLDDIQDAADNAAAADFITGFIRKITRDPQNRLHVSMAGGRKTMGFFTGCALTLYGRPEDQLSHVLVNPPFESNPDFFYPPRKAQMLQIADGKQVSTATARIQLADIPFVRLSHGLERELLDGELSFSDAVARTQQLIDPPELRIDLATQRVWLQGYLLRLPDASFIWMVWFATRVRDGMPPIAFDVQGARSLLRIVTWLDGSDDGRPGRAVKNAMRALQSKSPGKRYFEVSRSRLNAELAGCPGLAEAAVKRYQIQSSGTNKNKIYTLNLTAEQIHIEGEP